MGSTDRGFSTQDLISLDRESIRRMAQHLAQSLYPHEMPVFDQIADAWFSLDGPLSLGGSDRQRRIGLPFRPVSDLGSIEVLAFVGFLLMFLNELGLREALLQADSAFRLLYERQDLREELLLRVENGPPVGLGLDSRTAQEYMTLALEFIGPPSFEMGKPAPLSETRRCEFKRFTEHKIVDKISDIAEKYVVGFLNSGGGSVFWGIEPRRWLVVGMDLSEMQRDELQQKVVQKLDGIQPAVDPTSAYRIVFHSVVDGDQEPTGLWVVELAVTWGRRQDVYRTRKGTVYARLDGLTRKLTDKEIREFAQSREADI